MTLGEKIDKAVRDIAEARVTIQSCQTVETGGAYDKTVEELALHESRLARAYAKLGKASADLRLLCAAEAEEGR